MKLDKWLHVYSDRKGVKIKSDWVDDVRENVRGEWIKEPIVLTSNPPQYVWECSVCGYEMRGFNNTNFCPNCGAEMGNSTAMNKTINAEWICLGHRMGFCKHPDSVDYKCSNCGHEEYTLFFQPPDKCPNCGASMKGDNNV